MLCTPKLCRTLHRFPQNSLRVMKIIKPFYLGDIKAIGIIHLKQAGISLVARHMHGTHVRVSIFSECFIEKIHFSPPLPSFPFYLTAP